MITNIFVLGPSLGIGEPTMESIKRDYHTYDEQKYQMLLRWKQRNGLQATVGDLISILCDFGSVHIAEKFANYLEKCKC